MRRSFEDIKVGEMITVFERSKDGEDEQPCCSGKVVKKIETLHEDGRTSKILNIQPRAGELLTEEYELDHVYAVYTEEEVQR